MAEDRARALALAQWSAAVARMRQTERRLSETKVVLDRAVVEEQITKVINE